MKKESLVSIIIPVWNTGEAALKIIHQVNNQVYRNFEVIVVDDGSTDESFALLSAVRGERVKIIHQVNKGPSAARNCGIKEARGEYIIFVDSDDEIEAEFIPRLVGEMVPGVADSRALTGAKEASGAAFGTTAKVALAATAKRYRRLALGTEKDVYTEPRRKRKKGESLADYMIWLLILDGRMYGVTGKIFRAEVIRKHKIEFEVGRDFAEDTKFVLDYLRYAEGEIRFILEPLYVYNYGTETSVVKKSSLLWENWERSYQDLEEWAKAVGAAGADDETAKGGKLTLRTKMLLTLVRLRWKISHRRAQRRQRQHA